MDAQALRFCRVVYSIISMAAVATVAMAASPPVLVGSVPTASPAQTIGINGTTVYACDNNEISIINVANPAAPVVQGTAASPNSTTNTYCDLQRGNLVQMIDGTPPVLVTYDVSNPAAPKQVSSATVNKKFFGPPYFQGNNAFFGTNEIVFGSGYPGPISDQAGDFVSMNVTSFSAPAVLGTLETQTHGPVYGGSFNLYGTTPLNSQLAYVATTTSEGAATQTGIGQLWVVNTANPAAMSIVKKISVPGTLQVFGPLTQNNTAVTIADSGGWRQPCCGTNAFTGNIVITVYDITDSQNPQITANVTTQYLPGPAIGKGALVIGPHLFLYAGVIDASNNNYFMLVDTTDPTKPAIATYQTSASINYMRAVGATIYAPTDTGLQIYSIPGNSAPSVCTGCVLNAASFAKNSNGNGAPVAPGSLVAIFTSSLATSAAQFTTSSLPTSLSGVSATFNNIPAPIVSVTPDGPYPFVGAQVPFGVLSGGQSSASVPVVLTVNNVSSVPVQTPIVASAPGIPTIPPTGQGNAILVFVDPADNKAKIAAPTSASSAIGYATAPIPRGISAFFYATGLGAMTPPVADGSGTCSAANGLCNANSMPTVQIGGVPAAVAFAGQAPGYPGYFQVNITIPQNAPTGSSVTLTMKSADGNVTSNSTTIAVQ